MFSNFSSERFEFTRECGLLHDKFASTPLVVGGTSIERGSWPWLVAIYTIKSSGPLFRCAGTLVSQRYVLTSASCLQNAKRQYVASELLVSVGRHNLSNWLEQGTETVPVLYIHSHPEYEMDSSDHDIALLHLNSTVHLNQYVEPVCLWTNTDTPVYQVGQFGSIVGWGGASNFDVNLSMTPESVTIPVVPFDLCQEPINKSIQLNRSSFCAGSRNGAVSLDPCYGDLGSGFVTLRENRLALKGIVSNNGNLQNCKLKNYVLLTDVAKHTSWLRQFI